MQRKTIIGIAQALRAGFGDGVACYEDLTEQGLEEPAFYILCINANHEQRLGNRYRRSQSYDIHYFPGNHESGMAQETAEVAERLYESLEFITVNGVRIRGFHMRAQVIDGVLHFFVDYDLALVRQAEKEPYMEELRTKGGIRIDTKTE